MLGGEGIGTFYQTNFNITRHLNFTITEIERFMPFERDIYIGFLNKYLEETTPKEE